MYVAHGISPGGTLAGSSLYYVSDSSRLESFVLVGTDVDGVAFIALLAHDVGRFQFYITHLYIFFVVVHITLTQQG